ncbi:nitrite reductase (NAD(P)H) small subunit [Brachybacterium sp. Marseille-Q7125]|uniref:nitrite reductase (NAD(P)H) small subunit n=1 Tax=Brachybacterium sp. Marseille-Q7125 TaxID=2932815 RepID=UPI001FF1687F|nr:nitrite reductase (NAD(P)H) small subunit [Brachybacterium sp. Marseille-Q7125]
MSTDTTATSGETIEICAVQALSVERGAAALLPDGTQIGVFLLDDGSVHAVQQYDPYSETNILSRGLVGTRRITVEDEAHEIPTLASPMYKQTWNLETGEVLDAAGAQKHPIRVFDTEVRDGVIHVATAPRPLPGSAA